MEEYNLGRLVSYEENGVLWIRYQESTYTIIPYGQVMDWQAKISQKQTV